MADQNTSLPVRTQSDGTDERLHVKIVDGTNPAVNQMTVDSDKAAKVLDTGHDPSGTNRTLRLSQLGAMTPDGVYDVSNNTKPGNTGLIAAARAASPGDSDQTQRVTAITSSTVHALDIALHDESGAAFTESNPLPVTMVDSEGSEVNDYNTSAALAAGGSNSHQYTVTSGKTLKLSQIWASASGKMKIVIGIETGVATGVFTTKFVAFNSTSDPNIYLPVNENIAVAAGVRVQVTRTNNDNQAQDVYSTVSGHEI